MCVCRDCYLSQSQSVCPTERRHTQGVSPGTEVRVRVEINRTDDIYNKFSHFSQKSLTRIRYTGTNNIRVSPGAGLCAYAVPGYVYIQLCGVARGNAN